MKNESQEQQGVNEQKSILHQVTPLSKYVVMALCILLPFIGGWIGYHFAPDTVVEVVVETETNSVTSETPVTQDVEKPLVYKQVSGTNLEYDVIENDFKIYTISDGDVFEDSLQFSANRTFVSYQINCMNGCDFPAVPNIFDFSNDEYHTLRIVNDDDIFSITPVIADDVNPASVRGSVIRSYWEGQNTFVAVFDIEGMEYVYKSISGETPWVLEYINPNIVHTEVMKLEVADCMKECDLEIIKSIEGVDENVLIGINYEMLGSFLDIDETTDVRNLSGKVTLSKDLTKPHSGVDFIYNKIVYIDNGMLEYRLAFFAVYAGAPHPTKSDRYDIRHILFTENSVPHEHVYQPEIFLSEKANSLVLERFYPNAENSDMFPFAPRECFRPDSFPKDFHPQLWLSSKEVVFKQYYSYAIAGLCSGEAQIVIPFADILKQAPDLIHPDSILWKFQKDT